MFSLCFCEVVRVIQVTSFKSHLHYLCVIISYMFSPSHWSEILCDTGQLSARKKISRNNVHEWNHDLLLIHLSLPYLTFLFLLSHFFRFSYIFYTHC